VLLIGLSLMLLTWLATTPSGTAADGPNHYVRALAAGRGDLRGHPPAGEVTHLRALHASGPVRAAAERQLNPGRAALWAVAGGPRWLSAGLVLGTAVLQLVTWWLEARRLAVGTDGSFLSFGDVSWDPPLGWLPWALVTLLATAAYASAIVGAHGDRSRH
jgi:hypothetical protein